MLKADVATALVSRDSQRDEILGLAVQGLTQAAATVALRRGDPLLADEIISAFKAVVRAHATGRATGPGRRDPPGASRAWTARATAPRT